MFDLIIVQMMYTKGLNLRMATRKLKKMKLTYVLFRLICSVSLLL